MTIVSGLAAWPGRFITMIHNVALCIRDHAHFATPPKSQADKLEECDSFQSG